MKATQEQINVIQSHAESIKDGILAHAVGLAQLEKYQPGGSGDFNLRVRWDLFWSIPKAQREPIADSIYKGGGNDSHIDTALRRAFKGIQGLEQFAA